MTDRGIGGVTQIEILTPTSNHSFLGVVCCPASTQGGQYCEHHTPHSHQPALLHLGAIFREKKKKHPIFSRVQIFGKSNGLRYLYFKECALI